LSARGANSANRPRTWSDKAPHLVRSAPHDIDIEKLDTGELRVAVKGIDLYDPNTGDIRSNDVRDIAAWFIDTRGLSGSFRRILVVRARAGDRPLSTTEPTAPGRFKASDFHRLGGEAFGGERLVLWRSPGIHRRRGAFFRDLGEQPGLDRSGGPLLLRLIVGKTAGLEDDRA
jgi:hypothetical protein